MSSKTELLKGKNLKEATEILRNCKWRIISEDGIDYPTTSDIDPHRFNIYLEQGIITEVKFF